MLRSPDQKETSHSVVRRKIPDTPSHILWQSIGMTVKNLPGSHLISLSLWQVWRKWKRDLPYQSPSEDYACQTATNFQSVAEVLALEGVVWICRSSRKCTIWKKAVGERWKLPWWQWGSRQHRQLHTGLLWWPQWMLCELCFLVHVRRWTVNRKGQVMQLQLWIALCIRQPLPRSARGSQNSA